MKKIYTLPAIAPNIGTKMGLLPLLLCLATFAFSQKKSEFGFVLKGGTYGFPAHRNQDVYSFSDVNTTTYNAGRNYSLGVWSSWPLGNHVRFSAELLYRSIAFQAEQNFESSFTDITQKTFFSKSYQMKKTAESSMALPISFYFIDKKVAFSIGAGVSQAFSTNISGKEVSESTDRPENTRFYSESHSSWREFPPRYNVNAGLHYKIDSRTMLGLEYTFERQDILYYYAEPNVLLFCNTCGGDNSLPRPNMNSFSVSLRHNILD